MPAKKKTALLRIQKHIKARQNRLANQGFDGGDVDALIRGLLLKQGTAGQKFNVSAVVSSMKRQYGIGIGTRRVNQLLGKKDTRYKSLGAKSPTKVAIKKRLDETKRILMETKKLDSDRLTLPFNTCAKANLELKKRHAAKERTSKKGKKDTQAWRKTVSISQTRRDAKNAGLVRRTRPARTHKFGHAEIAARVSFCEEWLERLKAAPDTIDKIVFSDEHYVTSREPGSARSCFVPAGTPKHKMVPVGKHDWRNGAYCQIWGAVGVGYKSELKNVTKKGDWKLTAETYKNKCLQSRGVDGGGVIAHCAQTDKWFQQDGAKYHTAKVVLNYIASRNVKLMAKYPARSPSLNPIESVWKLLNDEIHKLVMQKGIDMTNGTRAWEVALEAWNALDQGKIDRIVKNWKKAMQDVIKAKGDGDGH